MRSTPHGREMKCDFSRRMSAAGTTTSCPFLSLRELNTNDKEDKEYVLCHTEATAYGGTLHHPRRTLGLLQPRDRPLQKRCASAARRFPVSFATISRYQRQLRIAVDHAHLYTSRQVYRREHEHRVLSRTGIDLPTSWLHLSDPAHYQIPNFWIIPVYHGQDLKTGSTMHSPGPYRAYRDQLVHALDRARDR